jgi:hypothetical protein
MQGYIYTFDQVTDSNSSHLKLCIDFCHVYLVHVLLILFMYYDEFSMCHVS